MPSKVKVYVGYITSEGESVSPGVYDVSKIDMADAQRKSIVTYVDADVSALITEVPVIPTIQMQSSSMGMDYNVVMEPTLTTVKVDKLKINSVPVEKISALKYVSAKTADAVVAERTIKPFDSYADLNSRVPLKSKMWELLAPLDFEINFAVEDSMSLSFT
jgi:DNA uptake protein ComE-like DNA-binding protein